MLHVIVILPSGVMTDRQDPPRGFEGLATVEENYLENALGELMLRSLAVAREALRTMSKCQLGRPKDATGNLAATPDELCQGER